MLSPKSQLGKRCGNFPLASLPARENPSCLADMEYESFDEFREMIAQEYFEPDGSLFHDEQRLVEIFEAFGNRFGSLMMREVLTKSKFFKAGKIIKSKALQLAALNADKKTAFRFCPIAHRNISLVIEVLTAKFDQFRFMTTLENPTIALAIAETFPFKTPWWLSISLSSHLPTSSHKIIDVSGFDTNALGTMVCTWLSAPDRVYRHRPGMEAPTEFESVSDSIVSCALAILHVRTHDFGKPLSTEHQIDELLGMRYRKAVEIQSWANKMHVTSTGVDMALPLYEKKVPYTVETARAALQRGKDRDWQHRFQYRYGLVKRRGDSVLAMIAQREDLRIIVLPIVIRFILDPMPPRFKPRGKRV